MYELVTANNGEFEAIIPFSKINENNGEFEAWATLEEIDASNEIIDIDKSWPRFVALADRFSKATDGANFGPVREQHDPNKASGHLISPPVIKQHESGKRGIYIHGVVTDDSTKKKLYAKTLTGVSIGGRYVGEMEKVTIDGRDAKKFVADPNHYGLVDGPCVKNALVTVVKMDGTEKVEKLVGYDPPQGFMCRGEEFHKRKDDARVCAEHLAKAAPKSADPNAEKASETADGYSFKTPEGNDSADYHRKAQDAHAVAADAHQSAQAKAKDEGDNSASRHHARMADEHDDHAAAHGAIAAAHEAASKASEGGDMQKIAEFADEKNKKYPIDSEAHVRAAWSYVNKAKNAAKYSVDDLKMVKSKIIAAWKAKIDKDGPPSAEKLDSSSLLEKCLQCVARLAYAAESIDQIADGIHCPTCSAYGCGCDPRCIGPRCGCCYACNMQFGADMPLSGATVSMIEQSAKVLMDAVVAASEDARAADEAEDAEAEATATMKSIDALHAALQDKNTLSKLQTALHVPRSNGSLKKAKESTVSETEKLETTIDGAALNKSMGELSKSIGEIADLIKADRVRVDAVEGDVAKLADGVDAMGKTLSKMLAFVADVSVDDPTDLTKVMDAITKKPAVGGAKLRAMRKAEDAAVDDAATPPAPMRHAFDVEPMRVAQLGN